MKTYFSFCVLFTFLIFGCSKTEDVSENNNKTDSVEADYIILSSQENLLTTQLLNANAETLTFNPSKSSLADNKNPDLSLVDGSDFIQYHKKDSCNGQITLHNFDNDSSISLNVFSDLNECDLTATALGRSGDLLFISYKLIATQNDGYYIRRIDLSSSEFNPIDITLDKKPVDLAISNSRLFILTLDELITDENSLSVMDLSSNTLIHEIDLGYNANQIFTDANGSIIISYDELHTTLDSSTLNLNYTRYLSPTVAPGFTNAEILNFDEAGRLFYAMPSGDHSSYDLVPATYDFSNELITLYAYENFLSEDKRKFEFEIETTTVVGYDEENGLMLVGYKKMNSAVKSGGLFRIQLEPEPKLIDHIDLDGVPYKIIVN